MVVSEILEKLVSSHKPTAEADRLRISALRRLSQRLSRLQRKLARKEVAFRFTNPRLGRLLFQVGEGPLLNGMPLEKTFDFGPQLARADRLAQIVSESGGHRVFAVALHRAGCEGQDGSSRKLGIASEFSDDVESVHPWHVQIENDEIRSKVPCSAQGLQAVRHFRDFIATTFKYRPHKLAAGGIVICYQDCFHVSLRHRVGYLHTALPACSAGTLFESMSTCNPSTDSIRAQIKGPIEVINKFAHSGLTNPLVSLGDNTLF